MATAFEVKPGVAGSTDTPVRTTMLFSISDKVGALDACLASLSALHVSLKRIESRPSTKGKGVYEFFIDFDAENTNEIDKVCDSLKKHTLHTTVISSGVSGHQVEDQSPWFPRKKADLDGFAEKVMEMGEDLSSDHPGAHDPAYRARRAEITRNARTYRHGQPIPRIEYTDQENETWGAVYNHLTSLFPTHACKEHRYVFPLLERNCGYSAKSIPQLEDISNFLRECTGFTLRPVMGLLSSRDFLNGLAFRVFHSTQYIRHHSKPLYTPEPDVCHELLGHVPLFADPDFAAFCQEIGLASLGASDQDIEKLATIFWFTVEFGLCQEEGEDEEKGKGEEGATGSDDPKKGGGKIRAYGAGLLSSFGELEYCLTDQCKKLAFDPEVTAVTKYPITTYQPTYFVASSFKDAQEKVRAFAARSSRPFAVRYNPYTESVEVLNGKDRVVQHAKNLQSDLSVLVDALSKLS